MTENKAVVEAARQIAEALDRECGPLAFEGTTLGKDLMGILKALYEQGQYAPFDDDEAVRCLTLYPKLVEALEGLCKLVRGSIIDCPADISSEPCVCGFHDALELGKKVLAEAKGEGK